MATGRGWRRSRMRAHDRKNAGGSKGRRRARPSGIARSAENRNRKNAKDGADEGDWGIRAFSQALVDLKARPWTIALDGRTISDEFLLVEILNIRSIGPNLVFGPDTDPSDGYFDVVLAQECHREELLTYLGHRASGRDTRLSLPTHSAREVVLPAVPEMHIETSASIR